MVQEKMKKNLKMKKWKKDDGRIWMICHVWTYCLIDCVPSVKHTGNGPRLIQSACVTHNRPKTMHNNIYQQHLVSDLVNNNNKFMQGATKYDALCSEVNMRGINKKQYLKTINLWRSILDSLKTLDGDNLLYFSHRTCYIFTMLNVIVFCLLYLVFFLTLSHCFVFCCKITIKRKNESKSRLTRIKKKDIKGQKLKFSNLGLFQN